jgi:hypothetical protein
MAKDSNPKALSRLGGEQPQSPEELWMDLRNEGLFPRQLIPVTLDGEYGPEANPTIKFRTAMDFAAIYAEYRLKGSDWVSVKERLPRARQVVLGKLRVPINEQKYALVRISPNQGENWEWQWMYAHGCTSLEPNAITSWRDLR